MADGDVTADGSRLISEWLRAQESVERIRESLSSANSSLRHSEEQLAKWLIPEDAKPGEKIAVWFGDSLIQAEVGGVVSGDGPVRAMSATRVTVRKRGKEHYRLREAS
jgi:hypothetical protein